MIQSNALNLLIPSSSNTKKAIQQSIKTKYTKYTNTINTTNSTQTSLVIKRQNTPFTPQKRK